MSRANYKKQRGLTLIEVLVSSLVFWIGILGVGAYTAAGIKTSASNQSRATAIKAATTATEPLVYNTRPDCLSAALSTAFPQTVSADNGKDQYVVSLLSAVDGKGSTVATGTPTATSILISDTTTWSSPVTVTLVVPHAGLKGATVNIYPSYSIILQNYTVACNA